MNPTEDKIQIPEILYYSYYTLDPATVSPYHSHSFYEFTYLFECDGYYYMDGKKIKLLNDTIILFPPGFKHGEIVTEGQQFNLFAVGLEGVKFLDIPGFYDNINGLSPFIDAGKYTKDIKLCCEEIRKEIIASKFGYRTIINGLIEKLIVLMLRSKQKTNTATNPKEFINQICIDYSNKKEIVSKIKYYIDFYYSSKISLEDIAHNVYLSQAYIIKLFKEEMGETPINYLIKVRINKAKELLLEGNLSIDEIIGMIGYTDVAHFSKIFKKYTGFSPSQYPKNNYLCK
jgi:AraC-type DNA-binding domain-containing proteins